MKSKYILFYYILSKKYYYYYILSKKKCLALILPLSTTLQSYFLFLCS